MKYKAFISYRHTENGRCHAVALETALKRYAKPTLARPMKIFRDEKHMRPDVSLPKLIRDGLENSEFLIFLAEKDSADSQWCGEELEYWCGHLQRTDRLIIALIDDDIVLNETHSVNFEQSTALPKLLQPYLTSIPLYMDLRWAKSATDTDLQHSKYRHEINALAARLRGVNPEDLNDEEIRVFRRNIRLRNGAIGVLLAMLLVSVGATFWALDAQKRANSNAVWAIEAQKKAENNAAESLRQKAEAVKNLNDYLQAQAAREQLALENQGLTGKNVQLKSEKEQLSSQVSDLDIENKKNVIKSRFATFKATGLRIKIESQEEVKSANKTRRTRELVLIFDLADVPEPYQGNQKLYLVITDNQGNPIADKNSIRATVYTPSGPVEIIAQQVKQVALENTQRLSFAYQLEDKLEVGNYAILIYCERGLLSNGTFRLK